jgi:hypothetical protein
LVVLIKDETGRHRSSPIDLDLAAQLSPPHRTIVSIVDPTTIGLDPRAYLDQEAA